MTVGDFFKRRLIRLQPMVVIGALIGAVMFYFQGCPVWDVSKISVTMLLVATLMNALLHPRDPRFRNPGSRRDVSAQRPELVAVLRIHRQHSLRAFPPQTSHSGSGRAGPARRLRPDRVRRMGTARRHLRRLRPDGREHRRRLLAPAVRVLGRVCCCRAYSEPVACQGSLLDRRLWQSSPYRPCPASAAASTCG